MVEFSVVGKVMDVYQGYAAGCVVHAYLLKYLLDSVGVGGRKVDCYWYGKSKQEVSCWLIPTSAGASKYVSFAARKGANDDAKQDEEYYFHALTILGTAPSSQVVYDPSYGSVGEPNVFLHVPGATLQVGPGSELNIARQGEKLYQTPTP